MAELIKKQPKENARMVFLRERRETHYYFVTSCLAKETVSLASLFHCPISDPLRPLKLLTTRLPWQSTGSDSAPNAWGPGSIAGQGTTYPKVTTKTGATK